MRLYSKHNEVCVRRRGRNPAVRKRFDSAADWAQELALYQLPGRPPAPRLLESAPGILYLEYLPFPTLLAVLDEQEAHGFSASPWRALGRWLAQMHAASGMSPSDGNLRNFLWDGDCGVIYGLDFEHYRPGPLEQGAANTAAFLLEYDPIGTPTKARIAALLQEELAIPAQQIEQARRALRARRASFS